MSPPTEVQVRGSIVEALKGDRLLRAVYGLHDPKPSAGERVLCVDRTGALAQARVRTVEFIAGARRTVVQVLCHIEAPVTASGYGARWPYG